MNGSNSLLAQTVAFKVATCSLVRPEYEAVAKLLMQSTVMPAKAVVVIWEICC